MNGNIIGAACSAIWAVIFWLVTYLTYVLITTAFSLACFLGVIFGVWELLHLMTPQNITDPIKVVQSMRHR